MEGYHNPVFLDEVLGYIEIEQDGWFVDATLGDGGHSLGVLEKGGKVLGIDTDTQALKRAEKRFRDLEIDPGRYILVKGNFRDLKQILQSLPPIGVQGKQTENLGQKYNCVLFDLGVSSLQLETPGRGFSFSKKGPLDMRMDQTLSVTALDLIKILSKGELYELFSKVGEEKLSRRIADAIVRSRTLINSTEDLRVLVEGEYIRANIKAKINPATKVFQALRIAVNDELKSLEEALPQALEVTKKNGCILVISFHSLEDRIVKFIFKSWAGQGFGQILTKKPIEAKADEVQKNPRSRSAKLRVFKKVI